jgi:hypothetical protein
MASANSCPNPSTRRPAERRRKHSKKLRRSARAEFRRPAQRGWALRLMFEDEARFGRMIEPRRVWTPPGLRPLGQHGSNASTAMRLAALIPQDSALDSLVLPETG